MHVVTGAAEYSAQQLAHGQSQVSPVEYLSIAVLAFLSVYLRERGSTESKPVDAPHRQTGE
jgi:hypothetical protein